MPESQTTDEHGRVEILVPNCPYCDEPLSGEIDGNMHKRCAEKFAEEMDYYDRIIG